MPKIELQPRADGYRVCRRHPGGAEEMLASAVTRSARPTSVGPANPTGVTEYDPLPRGEWSIHSAKGPLSVAELEEILAALDAAG